ncbi:MAG TPA: phosphotransferase [Blastocatellia bacterium]|nr:phosphotransferase [Blastocatellia bacterium]
MMQREATIYWLARHDADFEPLKEITSDLLLFDGAMKVIVLRLVPEPENLLRNQERLGSFSVDAAGSLGDALAIIHGRVGLRTRGDPPREAFPLEPPGILTAHRDGPLNQWLGQGQRRLVEIVREHSTLRDSLDSLASSWRFDSFIHGDMKFENCVLSRSDSRGKVEVKIVDWELADFGDACWDVGSLVQAYLYHRIRPSLGQRGVSLEARLENGGDQTGSMRAAVARFWQRYLAGRGMGESESRAFVERAGYCVSARMIQMALEVMHGQPEPPPAALSLLEAGAEIITCPGPVASAWQPFSLLASPTREE